MENIQNQEILKKQYETARNLNTRISIHEKYSTNHIGFGSWIFSNYQFHSGSHILELGCGTGDMWLGRQELLRDCTLTLSDFSEGMLENAKSTLKDYNDIDFKVIDIQDISFDDESFDVVIANMMLYHVPDLKRGLTEVRRVLKPGGKFYCATYGEHGITEYVDLLLTDFPSGRASAKPFTLQNGEEKLSPYFSGVQRLNYEDSLAVTDARDLADYIYSLSSMAHIHHIPRQQLLTTLESRKKDGVILVPKEYGMFCCIR